MRNRLFSTCVLLLLLSLSALAVPPTEEAIELWQEQGILEQKIAAWKAFKEAGGDAPNPHKLLPAIRGKRAAGTTQGLAVDTFHVLAILVDFSDHQYTGQGVAGTPAKLDSVLFSDRDVDPVYNATGSMTEFYKENSYGSFYIAGDITPVWYRMALPYSHYSQNDGFIYSGDLARDAVIAADPDVNYSKYDNDGDGYVDGVIIIHAGPGAEEGAVAIWSHVSGMSSPGMRDGKQFQVYAMCPEEYNGGLTNMGVYGHEYGHVLGLPDLYDVDGEPASSSGLGSWSMMAGGSWNGSGKRPAHFDAWCKIQLGFMTPITLSNNMRNVALPASEYSPIVYKLPTIPGGSSAEYWLVENRQKYGFDGTLPGSGLMIYHVDETQYSNINHLRYLVALEQADGLNELALSGSNGDGADPWPGSTDNRNFHDLSSPNSHDNVFNATTEVGVWRISDNDSIMYADLDVTFSRPYLTLRQHADSIKLTEAPGFSDGDGIFEAGEVIDVNIQIRNQMRTAYNWYVELVASNPNVQYAANDVRQSSTLNPTLAYVSSDAPVKISLPANFVSDIVDFNVIIRADSVNSPGGPGDRAFVDTFYYQRSLGYPRALLVDDDNGSAMGGDVYTQAFIRSRMAYEVWNKGTQGSPSAATLNKYNAVFWCTGHPTTGGTITAGDVTAMQQYLDQGGNLAIGSFTAGRQLNTIAPTFLPTYMKVQWTDVSDRVPFMKGYASNPLAPNMRFRLEGVTPAWIDGLSDPIDRGKAAFFATNTTGSANNGTVGVTYAGTHRTVFLGFPFEWVSANYENYFPVDSLFKRVLWYFEEFVPQSRYAGIVGNDSLHVLSSSPTFWWSYDDQRPQNQDQIEFEVGTDTSWTVAEMWSTGVVNTSDTTLTYAGAPLQDGVRYQYRLRTHDTDGWSDWKAFSFRMNSAPPTPTLLSPINGAIAAGQVGLNVEPPVDPEGDVLTFSFELYSDAAMTQLVSSTSGVLAQSPALCFWVPFPQPPDNAPYWWRARATDGYEISAWTDLGQFWFDAEPQAPSSFALIGPLDTLPPHFEVIPNFTWHRSTDADPNDSVAYTLQVSLGQSFGTPLITESLGDTVFTPVSALAYGTRYYWRVTATDQSSLTYQTPTATFWTWLPGDLDHNHGRDIGDLSAIIDFLFFGGTVTPDWLLDVDADCQSDISDLQRYIDYLFFSGAAPAVSCMPR